MVVVVLAEVVVDVVDSVRVVDLCVVVAALAVDRVHRVVNRHLRLVTAARSRSSATGW